MTAAHSILVVGNGLLSVRLLELLQERIGLLARSLVLEEPAAYNAASASTDDLAIMAFEGFAPDETTPLIESLVRAGTPVLPISVTATSDCVIGPLASGLGVSLPRLSPLERRLQPGTTDERIARQCGTIVLHEVLPLLRGEASPLWTDWIRGDASGGLLQGEGAVTDSIQPPREDPSLPPPTTTADLSVAKAISRRQSPRAIADECPRSSIESVIILGGGTAGYLTALTLRTCRPELKVQLIESSDVPVIGVGEATTSEMPPYLYKVLGFDAEDFHRNVQPTWKLGIRFEWGHKFPYFNYPFDEGRPLESLVYGDDITGVSLISRLMSDNKGLVYADRNGPGYLGAEFPYAYHLENRRFVQYLKSTSAARGVHILDRKIVDCVVVAGGEVGDDDDHVGHLIDSEGQHHAADLYIDCSGFRSMLLGRKLGTPYIPFSDSLLCDSALTFKRPHGGDIVPYTTARTMDSGWCWRIPQIECDHHGYVYSSAFADEEMVTRELGALYPDFEPDFGLKFRSGRYESCWKGNVIAVGNAYGFVEPLESTAIQAILAQNAVITRFFPRTTTEAGSRRHANERLAALWDYIRWFLAMHYRYNQRSNSTFWQHCRRQTDDSGSRQFVSLFEEGAPLTYRAYGTLASGVTGGRTFNDFGYDMLLLGMGVPATFLDARESVQSYTRRQASYAKISGACLDQASSLAYLRAEGGELLRRAVDAEDGWITEAARRGYRHMLRSR